jgi:prevent-host-death family protein
MTIFSEDIHPVSDLRRKAHELVGQTSRTSRPIAITQHGRPAAVLVSVQEWERRQQLQELLMAILQGERDFDAGEVVEEEEALAHLRAILKPRDP